ncbi:hypothetical protein ACR79S_09785 [Sphingobacterium spiritivorum]|uniref:hypothetical protein n=2 Tax=Sphingobacterium spiritivorum TaxID=258 RepID=UPI003DA638DD
MKIKTLSLAILIILSMSQISCSKKETIPTPLDSYYVKAKFNGEMKTFTYYAQAEKGMKNGNFVHVPFSASQNEEPPFPSMSFEIWNLEGNITPGVYSETEYLIMGRYSVNGENLYNNVNKIDDFKIRVTSITEKEFKGTFEGTLTNDSNSDLVLKVTEGEFFVPFK